LLEFLIKRKVVHLTMDAALLAEREAFKRKAMAVPVLENKKKKVEEPPKKGFISRPTSSSEKVNVNKLKSSMGGSSSQYKFGVLARIVRHMKARHMDGEDHPLLLEEILDETNQLDVSSKTRMWLQNEALKQNPKIEVTDAGDRYMFRAPFKLRDKKSLMKLLKRKDLNGEGGVYYDDVNESLAKCEKIVQNLTTDGKLIQIPRPCDKKKVLFYYDHSTDFDVDDEFIKQWRSVSVDGVDDAKIEEYLDKQGIRSMQDQGMKKMNFPKRKKGQGKRKNRAPKDNEHMKDVLQDYSEMTADRANK